MAIRRYRNGHVFVAPTHCIQTYLYMTPTTPLEYKLINFIFKIKCRTWILLSDATTLKNASSFLYLKHNTRQKFDPKAWQTLESVTAKKSRAFKGHYLRALPLLNKFHWNELNVKLHASMCYWRLQQSYIDYYSFFKSDSAFVYTGAH